MDFDVEKIEGKGKGKKFNFAKLWEYVLHETSFLKTVIPNQLNYLDGTCLLLHMHEHYMHNTTILFFLSVWSLSVLCLFVL